ncbi:hypothetical protein GQX74_001566 [Glossina fuscipes]|nr:hypothetical protein GQX74_001566 [Glossina fuscipes]
MVLKGLSSEPLPVSSQPLLSEDCRSNIESLYQQLTKLIEAKPRLLAGNLGDENTDPAAQPLFWISKWVDYSDKYDFGHQLCDEGIGVMFNDTTKLILLPNDINVHFIDKDGKETYMTNTDYCKSIILEKVVFSLPKVTRADDDDWIGNYIMREWSVFKLKNIHFASLNTMDTMCGYYVCMMGNYWKAHLEHTKENKG